MCGKQERNRVVVSAGRNLQACNSENHSAGSQCQSWTGAGSSGSLDL